MEDLAAGYRDAHEQMKIDDNARVVCADEARAKSAPATSPQRATEHAFAVYVAAAATPSAAARVAATIAALRADGFVVTCTWPETVAVVGSANPRDASDADRRGWSTQDLNEIDAARAVLFLVPEPPEATRGAWFEAGYSYSERKHLVFSGDTKQSVFCALGREFATDAAAIAYLRELRDRARVEAGLDELSKSEAEVGCVLCGTVSREAEPCAGCGAQ